MKKLKKIFETSPFFPWKESPTAPDYPDYPDYTFSWRRKWKGWAEYTELPNILFLAISLSFFSRVVHLTTTSTVSSLKPPCQFWSGGPRHTLKYCAKIKVNTVDFEGFVDEGKTHRNGSFPQCVNNVYYCFLYWSLFETAPMTRSWHPKRIHLY